VERIVVDTNVLVAALLGGGGASRAVLRLCLQNRCQPLMGEKLFYEYCDVIGRPVVSRSPLIRSEREELLEAFLSGCSWVSVSFLWRPNLSDEGDNHVVELAVAGMADTIVTNNERDFVRGELRFDALRVESPATFLGRWRKQYGHDDDSNS